MAKSKLVGLVFESWKDLDRVLTGLSPEEAMAHPEGGSSFAWTLAHLTQHVDTGINVRFQKESPHELIGQKQFSFGGTGDAKDWQAIQEGVREIRESARKYLGDMDDNALDQTIPYDGSFSILRQKGLSLRYTLLRICAHYYFHIGEIAAKRNKAGHRVGDYPGLLEECA